MLSYFKNEQIINEPVLDQIDLKSMPTDHLSVEYHKYIKNDISLFTVHDQMDQRVQIKVLQDWILTMISGYINEIPESNLSRVNHSMLLISFAMITISNQIKT